MSEPGPEQEAWPPASYRRLRSLMGQGRGQRAPGPCAIPGCTLAVPDPRPLAPPFVWDHCHAHDHARGILCRIHNVVMWPVDGQDHVELRRQLARYRGALVLADLAAYWARCPGCAALGPWQPVMVRHTPRIVERASELGARDARAGQAAERQAAEDALARLEYERRSAAAMRGAATRRARPPAECVTRQDVTP